MNRKTLLDGIIQFLSVLRYSVELHNSLNHQDINVVSENFFRDFLNLAFGYNLKNINIVEKNARAIDLGDEVQRIAIQVTSTSGIAKIKHTHAGFVAGGLDTKYDRLVVLIIGAKKVYKQDTLGGDGVFAMSIKDDVWGLEELLALIDDLTAEKLLECFDYLKAGISIRQSREANEVLTLLRLIEVLSESEVSDTAADIRFDPDPDGKINARFADYADFLKRQYTDLYAIYGGTLAEVASQADIGHGRMLKLQVYLTNWSDRVLHECGGNPELALETMVIRIMDKMGDGTAGFDESAVRFYLIDQLIRCNVFPNKAAVHA